MAGIIDDDRGNPSTMRVMSMISLIASIAFSAYVLYAQPEDPSTGVYIISSFLIGAFCPKVFQKYAEAKMVNK